MEIPFSQWPGRHERHFVRKVDNRLFPRPLIDFSDEELLEAQRLDHEEIVGFLATLRKLVEQAVSLKPNEESDVVLDLKAELEKLYEQACRLGDQQGNNKSAIGQLLTVIMGSVRAHAGGDSKAEDELLQEETARQQHFALLEHVLVADLIDPDSLILEDELVAVMLSEDKDQVLKAMTLFEAEQRLQLADQARQLLESHNLADSEQYRERVALIAGVDQPQAN